MKTTLPAIGGACLLALAPCAPAQTQSSEGGRLSELNPSSEAGVPIEKLLAAVARKTGKRFVIDPRVHGAVALVGIEPTELSYADLLTVLSIHGYAAVDEGRLVQIIPDGSMRAAVMPTIGPKETRAPDEYVTSVIPVKNASAPQLVPVLRPLMPQNAHLAATVGSNSLVLTDRFANLRRIEGLVRELDTAEAARPHARAEGAPPAMPDAKP
jgi:general secretion pathway protein D